jgi:predicted Fe-Mo cluster-binding NifX family protein
MVAAAQVASLEVDVVLTGYVGPHGVKKLRSRNIKIVQDEDGTVEASLRRYLKKYGTHAPRPRRPLDRPSPSDHTSFTSRGMRFLRESIMGETDSA